MNNRRYFEIIIIFGCGFCGGLSSFAGGGSSKLNRALEEIEKGPLIKREVPEVIEMQPLLGSRGDWVVYYEPVDDSEGWGDDDSPRDEWLEHMEEEQKLDEEFPSYGAMSTYPQYTAVSRNRCILEIGPIADEDGMVRFVKNQKMDEVESACCDKLIYQLWSKNCLNSCGVAYWWMKLSVKDEKYGSCTRNKSSAAIRTEWF